jgi:hypothetical protein
MYSTIDWESCKLKYYCHINDKPLKSITQLPESEALALAKKHRDENPCNAHNRFGSISVFDKNFVSYYRYRKIVEKQLHERFIAIGGKPQTAAPYYFFVQNWGLLHEDIIVNEINNGVARIMEIGLQNIDILDISFVLGDSMVVVKSDEWDGLFLKDTLTEALTASCGFDNYFDSIKQQYHYIEAQLWTDKYHHLFHTV